MSSDRFPPPGPGPSPDPPLHEMSWKQFEKFCREVARETESDVLNAGLYEKEGLKQYGADFFVETRQGVLVVGSCKAHKDPAKGVITNAAKKFVENWDAVWKSQGVVKFILCLAAPVETQLRIDHVAEAKQIVSEACGIDAEVWDRDTLVSKCARLPHVVQRYMHTQWKLALCDGFEPFRSEMGGAYLEQLTSRIEAHEQSQNPLLETALQELQRLLLKGARQEALRQAEALQANLALWTVATPEHKAQVLRTKAIILAEDDVDAATQIYTDAAALDAPSDRYFDAILEHHRNGPGAALEKLDLPRTERERVLKGGLLIETRDYESALELLETPCEAEMQEADRQRSRAVAFIGLGRADEAITASGAACDIEPDAWAPRLTRATAHYARALSPAIGFPGLNWPSPYPTSFARRDAGAVRAKREALTLFDDLHKSAETPTICAALQIWQFAAWLDEPSERHLAERYLADAFGTDHFHQGLVIWAFARRLPFDVEKASLALDELIKDGNASPDVYSSRLLLLSEAEEFDAALAFVDAHEPSFERLHPDAPALWRKQLRSRRSGPPIVDAFEEADQRSTASFVALYQDAQASPQSRFEAANILSDREAWSELWDGRSFLLETVSTLAAFRIAAFAAAEHLPPNDALSFISDTAPAFASPEMPPDLAGLITQLRADGGDVSGAVTEADTRYSDPSQSEFLNRAIYRVRAGDLRGAGHIVRQAAKAGNPGLSNPGAALSWANTIKSAAPAVATDLLRSATGNGGDPASTTSAVGLALRLIPEEAAPYIGAMVQLAQSGTSDVAWAVSVEDVVEFMREHRQTQADRIAAYERGEIFSHALYREQMGLAFLAPTLSDRTYVLRAPLTGYAARAFAEPIAFSALVLDSTTLLLLEALGLWSPLLDSDISITLPASWSLAILAMQEASDANQPDYASAYQAVSVLLDDERLSSNDQPEESAQKIDLKVDASGQGAIALNSFPEHFATWQVRGFPEHIHLEPGVAIELAKSRNLEPLLHATSVAISALEAQDIRQTAESGRLGSDVAKRLGDLQTTLAAAVLSGRVQLTSLAPGDPANTNAQHVVNALREVAAHPAAQGLALAIDDRKLCAFSSLEDKPTVTTFDIIAALERNGALDRDAAAERREALRALGFGYYPPHAEEVFEALRGRANGAAAAERQLLAMAKAFGQLAADHTDMLSSSPFGPLSERDAVFQSYLLASHVLRQILTDGLGGLTEDAQAMLWLTDHFRLDWGGVSESGAGPFVAWHSSMLFAFLAVAGALSEGRLVRARRMLDILYTERIDPAFQSHPELLAELHQQLLSSIRHYLHDASDDGGDPDMPAVRKAIVGRFLDLLPTKLKSVVYREKDIADAFGVKNGINLGEHRFGQDAFWTAIDAAGESGSVLSSLAGVAFTVKIQEDGTPTLRTSDDVFHLAMMHPAICLKDKAARKTALSSFLDTLHIPPADQTMWRRRFGQTKTVKKREALVSELMSTSVRGKAGRLAFIDQDEEISVDELVPPDLATLETWLGLSGLEPFCVERAFNVIADKHGVQEAVYRWAGAPIALPARAHEWVGQLNVEEREQAAQALFSTTAGPVAHTNLITLFDDLSGASAVTTEVAADLLTHIGDRARVCHAYARTSEACLLAKADTSSRCAHAAVAGWVWSEQLIAAMAPIGIDVAELIEFFGQAGASRAALVNLLCMDDVLAASRCAPEQLVAACAARLRNDSREWAEATNKVLVDALTIRGEGEYPRVSLLGVLRAPNPHRAWLASNMSWLPDLLELESDLARSALSQPEQLRQNALDHEPMDFVTLCILGTADLPSADVERVLKAAESQAPSADADILFHMMKTLSDLRSLTDAQHEERLNRFADVFARHGQLAKVEPVEPSLLSYLELAARACLRASVSDAWSDLDRALRAASRGLDGADNSSLRQFVSTICDVCPMSEREQFGRLHALLQSAIN